MKITLLADIHGNLPALEKVLKIEKNSDLFIILGDVVNYGPWSNDCVSYLNDLNNKILIMGNHEKYFIKKKCLSKNFLAKEFFKYSFKGFNKFELIKKYKNYYDLENFRCVHTINNQYIYRDTNLSFNLAKNYIIGHSHQQYKIKKNKYIVINPGSIGQNREFINVISYANIYDNFKKKIIFKNKKYRINLVISEMKKKMYPNICLNYYLRGSLQPRYF